MHWLLFTVSISNLLCHADFHTSYTQTAEGLPPEIIEAILSHKDLQIQCEAQVLLFVLDYIDGTQVEPAVAAQLFQHVRMAYLSNERLVWLQQQSQSSLPSDLLLQGALLRLSMQDQPSEMASAVMQPRSSYCSNLQYGLPGGQEHIDLPVHHVWDLLAPNISVKVSGVSEGRPRNVVLGSRQEGPDRWFSTSESAHPAPWVELHLPHNVRLLSLQHYTFTHGHHRSSYFRMQKWESQAGSTSCMRPGARFYSLQHKMEGAQQQGNDYLVSLAEYRPPVKHDWRVLRLVGDGPQQDGVHRLSLKDLKLYGTVRVNLLEQAEGMCITKAHIQAALSQSPSGVHPSTKRPRALPHSPTRILPPVTHSLYQNQY
ncbi:TPA: Bardet-Biedl syndrome 5 protein, variant 4 [Trebouxia sp. C0006]